jgi:hypothetical protein
MAFCQNDYDACAALSEESLRIATEVKDVEAVGRSLILRAMPFWAQGDTAAAAKRAESALSLAKLMRAERACPVRRNALFSHGMTEYSYQGLRMRSLPGGRDGLFRLHGLVPRFPAER